jgi:hypothetical protein
MLYYKIQNNNKQVNVFQSPAGFETASVRKTKQGFQRSAGDGKRLVRYGKTVRNRTTGIYVARLHSAVYGYSRREYAAENAVYSGADRGLSRVSGGRPYKTRLFAFFHHVAYFSAGFKDAVYGGAKQPFRRISSHVSGNAGIGKGASFGNDTSKAVTPLRLYDRMAVLSRGETGSHADYHGSAGNGRAGIFFSHDCVNDAVRGKPLYATRRGIDKNGNIPRVDDCLRFFFIPCKNGGNVFNFRAPFIDRFRKTDGTAHGHGETDLRHQYAETGVAETQGDARCKIARAFDDHKHYIRSQSFLACSRDFARRASSSILTSSLSFMITFPFMIVVSTWRPEIPKRM